MVRGPGAGTILEGDEARLRRDPADSRDRAGDVRAQQAAAARRCARQGHPELQEGDLRPRPRGSRPREVRARPPERGILGPGGWRQGAALIPKEFTMKRAVLALAALLV